MTFITMITMIIMTITMITTIIIIIITMVVSPGRHPNRPSEADRGPQPAIPVRIGESISPQSWTGGCKTHSWKGRIGKVFASRKDRRMKNSQLKERTGKMFTTRKDEKKKTNSFLQIEVQLKWWKKLDWEFFKESFWQSYYLRSDSIEARGGPRRANDAVILLP